MKLLSLDLDVYMPCGDSINDALPKNKCAMDNGQMQNRIAGSSLIGKNSLMKIKNCELIETKSL